MKLRDFPKWLLKKLSVIIIIINIILIIFGFYKFEYKISSISNNITVILFLIIVLIYPFLYTFFRIFQRKWKKCYTCRLIFEDHFIWYITILPIAIFLIITNLYLPYNQSKINDIDIIFTSISVSLGFVTLIGAIFAYLHYKGIQKRFYTFNDFIKKCIKLIKESTEGEIRFLTLSPLPGNISSKKKSENLKKKMEDFSNENGNVINVAFLCGEKEIWVNFKDKKYVKVDKSSKPSLNINDDNKKCFKKNLYEMIIDKKGEYPLWINIFLPFINSKDNYNIEYIFVNYLNAIKLISTFENNGCEIKKLKPDRQSEVVIIKNSSKVILGIPMEFPFKKPQENAVSFCKDQFINSNDEDFTEFLKESAMTAPEEIHWIGFEINDSATIDNVDRYLDNFFNTE